MRIKEINPGKINFRKKQFRTGDKHVNIKDFVYVCLEITFEPK